MNELSLDPPKSELQLSKSFIMRCLNDLNYELQAIDKRGEINIYGGAAMVLVFDARPATKDIDAVFAPTDIMRISIDKVGKKNGIHHDWMNDAVKGWLSANNEVTVLFKLSNLTVHVPTPEYLFAMKAIAARIDGSDRKDVLFLMNTLGIKSLSMALDIIENYYPRRMVPAKTQFFLEEVIDDNTE